MNRHLNDPVAVARRKWGHGQGRIAGDSPGLVTVEGSPAQCQVRLIDRKSGVLRASTWSASDGTYEFVYLDLGRLYTVYAIDPAHQHNAAIEDLITPVQMTEFP